MGEYKPRRSKVTAVVLAIFFSHWTWLYTFRTDGWKFWLGLGLNVLLWWTLIVPIGVSIWAIVDQAGKPSEYYINYFDY